MTRILIAEDEPRITSFLEKGLRANGFTTLVAETGPLAAADGPRRRLRPADPRPRPARPGRPAGARARSAAAANASR